MGELALRRWQAGLEAVRGTPVAATRKVYGTLEPTRDQPRRYAVEDRGIFTEKFRANAKLVDAGFKANIDITPEDLPYWLDMLLRGGVVPTAIGASGPQQWVYIPDQSSDTLKTRTFEWGDDSIAYRGAYATADNMDITIPLDDAVRGVVNGWVQEWLPSGFSGFTGFTGGMVDRAVESEVGWQQRLFMDPASGTIGTTQVTGRFVSASMGFRNQNKRKYFGDGSPLFTNLGRGRRQTSCAIMFEAFDTTQVADLFNTNVVGNLPVERAVRIMLTGGALGASNVATTNGALTGGTPITAIAVTALAAAIPGGTALHFGAAGTAIVGPAGAASSATSIPIISWTPLITVATSSTVAVARSIAFDFWGYFDGNPNWGARETNVTFNLTLQGVYDVTAAKEAQITVINGLNAAAGIS